jgi:integrase
MSRRGKGEGSIRLRADGRWEATLTEAPMGGRRRRRSYFGKTRAEAARKLTVALKAHADNLPLPSERLTVATFLGQWLEAKEPGLRPESFRRYREACHLHVIPEIGRKPLARLTPADLQMLYARIRAKGLSGTSLSLLHGVLHKALDDAARWSLVVRNVADLVDAPRRSTPEMRTLTPEEAARLLLAARGEPLEAFYTVALTCGLRLGELQALRWRDLDLDRRRLQVTATLQAVQDGAPVLAEPKTARSKRGVYLSDMAVEALRAHRARQLEQRLLLGGLYQDNGLVFANAFGRPLDGNNIRTRSFARLLERVGLGPMRFHSLRHAAATLLMAEGVPVKVVSEMLGHADVTVTLKVYSHVLPGMQQQAADAMDRLFAQRR